MMPYLIEYQDHEPPHFCSTVWVTHKGLEELKSRLKDDGYRLFGTRRHDIPKKQDDLIRWLNAYCTEA